jgi:L-rhamnose-H+ transport protein
MNIFLALTFILIAGLINGAFAVPSKYTKKWRFENTWLQYSIWGFLILPWVAIYFLAPQVMQIYEATPSHLIWIMIIGGFLFGVGQVGFAFAIDMIGIGLAFVLCLGIGTGLGFLLPLVFQHPEKILTPFGIMTICGTGLAIAGIIVSTYAGQLRDRHKRSKPEWQHLSKRFYWVGVILAAIAGIFSAGQNFSFSLTSNMQQIALIHGAHHVGAAIIMWPGFLVFTFIPYAGYMLYLHKKNHSFACYRKKGTFKYFFLTLIMGACWFGTLIFYSKASMLIGSLGPVIGWPLLMVLIILTSNFLGWRHKEWEGCKGKTLAILWLGLILLMLSVVVLGYSSTL